METQKVDRFCRWLGELYDENYRFCVNGGYKRRPTMDSEGNNERKKRKRLKSLDEYIIGKRKQRRGFLNQSFCKMLINRVKATEKDQIHVQKQTSV